MAAGLLPIFVIFCKRISSAPHYWPQFRLAWKDVADHMGLLASLSLAWVVHLNSFSYFSAASIAL
jgi:hypothetical protein